MNGDEWLGMHVLPTAHHEIVVASVELPHGLECIAVEACYRCSAYDPDPLDAALATPGIEMIAPHRRSRTRPKTQEGQPLLPLQAALGRRAPLRLVGQLPPAGGAQ